MSEITDLKDNSVTVNSQKHKIKQAFELGGTISAKTDSGYIHKLEKRKYWESNNLSEYYFGNACLDILLTGKEISVENYGKVHVKKIINNDSVPGGIIDTGNYHIEYEKYSVNEENRCINLNKAVVYDINAGKIISGKEKTICINY